MTYDDGHRLILRVAGNVPPRTTVALSMDPRLISRDARTGLVNVRPITSDDIIRVRYFTMPPGFQIVQITVGGACHLVDPLPSDVFAELGSLGGVTLANLVSLAAPLGIEVCHDDDNDRQFHALAFGHPA